MKYWDFTSDNSWFSFTLPENWSEYDADEGTYAFFNTQKWSGNLRISSFRWTGVEEGTDKAYDYIISELNDKPGATLIQLAGYDTAHFQEAGSDQTIILFWITGLNNALLLCSFSFDEELHGTDLQNKEVQVVHEMLNTIQIIG
ncbi:MAG: DUF3805 domain-containing protein [Bacteroidota bacterium]